MTRRARWRLSRRRRTLAYLGAAAAIVLAVTAGGVTIALADHPVANAAKESSFSEISHLRVTKSAHSHVEGRGTATGTLNGQLTIRFTIINFERTTNSFAGWTSGGGISGSGTSNYYVSGNISHFNGTMAITNGSGQYSRVRAYGLREEGSMNRNAGTITLRITGRYRS